MEGRKAGFLKAEIRVLADVAAGAEGTASPRTTTQDTPSPAWMAVKMTLSSRHIARDMALSLPGWDSSTKARRPS